VHGAALDRHAAPTAGWRGRAGRAIDDEELVAATAPGQIVEHIRQARTFAAHLLIAAELSARRRYPQNAERNCSGFAVEPKRTTGAVRISRTIGCRPTSGIPGIPVGLHLAQVRLTFLLTGRQIGINARRTRGVCRRWWGDARGSAATEDGVKASAPFSPPSPPGVSAAATSAQTRRVRRA